MRYIRTFSAALLSLLLALVFDGALLLACPASFGSAAASDCQSCPRKKSHCPIAPDLRQCPLVESDRLSGETAAKVPGPDLTAKPVIAEFPPSALAALAPVADDWHHAAGLHIRIRVLRI
ncbi:MAG: hypothetical protein ACKV2U_19630 [Bryobacteraceae bacterium]